MLSKTMETLLEDSHYTLNSRSMLNLQFVLGGLDIVCTLENVDAGNIKPNTGIVMNSWIFKGLKKKRKKSQST